jgi:hypothetical protein
MRPAAAPNIFHGYMIAVISLRSHACSYELRVTRCRVLHFWPAVFCGGNANFVKFTLLLLLFLVQSQKRAVAPARAARRASVSVVARASSAAKQSAKNSATGLTVLARCGSSHSHSFIQTTTVSSKYDAAAACSRIMLCSTASSAALPLHAASFLLLTSAGSCLISSHDT